MLELPMKYLLALMTVAVFGFMSNAAFAAAEPEVTPSKSKISAKERRKILDKADQPSAAAKAVLKVGDPAPAIVLAKTVKGEPIDGFDRDHVFVVEFWATWCGPCRETIPHLTALASKFAGKAKFLGVSVAERDPEAVAPFVAKMGDKMQYTVATDRVPSGGKAADGFMIKAWLQAAGLDGIPSAFVVDTDGKIAWIGSPASPEMEAKIEELTGKLKKR